MVQKRAVREISESWNFFVVMVCSFRKVADLGFVLWRHRQNQYDFDSKTNNSFSRIQIRTLLWPFFLVLGGFPCNVFKSKLEVGPSDSLINRTAQIQSSWSIVNYDCREINIFRWKLSERLGIWKPILHKWDFIKVKRWSDCLVVCLLMLQTVW